MIKLKKQQTGNVLSVEVEGTIDEFTKFDEITGAPGSELKIRCAGINRINSVGIKLWINHFAKLKNSKIKVTLIDCSTALVEQMNMIVNFAEGMIVESVMVPFSCQKCKSESLISYRVDDLKKLEFEIPEIKCPQCSGPAIFDDLPEEYFDFLMR